MTAKTPQPEPGQLLARPRTDPSGQPQRGLSSLPVPGGRDALLYVPKPYMEDQPAPLAVMLHGAGGEARQGLALLEPLAEATGTLIVAPASWRQTWDVIAGGYGPDVAAIDLILGAVFARYRVDPARLAVGGFSDGASYALSLGVMNGDLFSHIIAFSPGFMAPARQEGEPRVFISHGSGDTVLPIDRCSRRLVPRLEAAGYPVRYLEFDGPHTVPALIARDAMDWFLAGG